MSEVNVYLDLEGEPLRVGTVHRLPGRGFEVVSFEYGSQPKADLMQLFRRMAFTVLVSNVDDHLRNHAFLYEGIQGWRLSPAYDLNPTPADVRERRLTTNLTIDDGTCDLDVLIEAAEQMGIAHPQARQVIGEVALVTNRWRSAADRMGAPRGEIERMASAFEHSDLQRALALA